MPKLITPKKLQEMLIETLENHKAENIIIIDIRKLTDIADYMIICSANSTTHAKALADNLHRAITKVGVRPIGTEGENTNEWILIDLGVIIVHIMLPTVREFYSLEKLWNISNKPSAVKRTKSLKTKKVAKVRNKKT
jgi:ribosome-associated protein